MHQGQQAAPDPPRLVWHVLGQIPSYAANRRRLRPRCSSCRITSISCGVCIASSSAARRRGAPEPDRVANTNTNANADAKADAKADAGG
jgi:hypothetical protein